MTKSGTVATCLLWLATAALPAETPARPATERSAGQVNRAIRADVDWARATAIDKLRSSRCELIFSDFQDSNGHTLQSNLESRGETGADLMRRLEYRDGSGEWPCKRDGVAAFATPGAAAIFICGQEFHRALREHRNLAANILLHEGLHSLGLEEQSRFFRASSRGSRQTWRFPTSLEITERVAFRCGD
jgi:hypothetical protein